MGDLMTLKISFLKVLYRLYDLIKQNKNNKSKNIKNKNLKNVNVKEYLL